MSTVPVGYFSSSKEHKPSHEITAIYVCCVHARAPVYVSYCPKICAIRLIFTNLEAHSNIVLVNFLQSTTKTWRRRELLRPQQRMLLDP